MWDRKYVFFTKRKETSVSSENWICSHQQPGANALWDYPNSLPQGCVGFHQASLLATLRNHTVSLPLHASYWSLNSLQLAVVIFYEASAIFYSVPMVWVIQKRVMQEGRSKQSIFLLRGWEDPTTLLSVTSLLRDADAVSACLLVSQASSHKRRSKELNTYGLVTRSLMKAIIMLSNTWSI